MYQQHSLEVFQYYFKKDTKAWSSPVRLIYSDSFLHNISSNLPDVNAHFLFFLSFFTKTISNLCVIVSENKKETLCFQPYETVLLQRETGNSFVSWK